MANGKKPFYKRWWFWLIVVIVIGVIVNAGGGSSGGTTNTASSSNTSTQTASAEETITYTPVTVDTMVDDLERNALNAAEKYKGKYLRITGRISNIDSNGSYFTLDPVHDDFSFINVQVFVKRSDRDRIRQFSKGEVWDISVRCTDVGEVLGYSAELQ